MPWLDEENLLPGQDWQREIPRAVRQSDAVIVCLSRGSINRAGYVQKEIKFALDVANEQPEDTIFLIPLKLEECEMPERLSRWQWVESFQPQRVCAFDEIVTCACRQFGRDGCAGAACLFFTATSCVTASRACPMSAVA